MTMQEVIDFLLDLLRNEETQAEFERAPEAVLADRGLEGVTAQDVRDARLQLADSGGARAVGDDSPPGGNDPIREIRFTEDNFAAEPAPPAPPPAPDIFEQTTNNILAIDDRDTLVVQNTTTSDDDITVIQDSFNDQSVNEVTAIQDNSTTVGVVESGPVGAEAEPAVNPPPAADVTEPGAEIPAPEGTEPEPVDTEPVDTAPIDTEPADDTPADIGVVEDTDDTAADTSEPEPVEEGDPDQALDTAVI
jgi:hypothetical protein